MSTSPNEISPASAQLVGIAILASPLVLLVLLFVMDTNQPLPFTEQPLDPNTLGGAALVISLAAVAVSFGMKRILLSAPVQEGRSRVQQRFNASIVAMAIAEFAALLGFVVGLLTGAWAWVLILVGVGLGGMILHVPTKRFLLDL